MKEVLQKITEETQKERDLIESGNSSLVKSREEFSKLKPLNEKFKQDKKVAQNIYSQAQKSENYYSEQLAKLNQIKLKSAENSPDFQKQEEKVRLAEIQKNQDVEAKLKTEEEMKPTEIEYKKEFIQTVLRTLEIISETRANSCAERSKIGSIVEQISNDFVQPEDTSLQQLEDELNHLEQLTV